MDNIQQNNINNNQVYYNKDNNIIDAQINQFNLPNNSNPQQYNNNQKQNQFENTMNMNNFHQNMQKINGENLNLKARLNDGKNKIEELSYFILYFKKN